MNKTKFQTMLMVFFDKKEMVHSEFIPHGETVIQVFYLEVV
jgi:hypothetical protein